MGEKAVAGKKRHPLLALGEILLLGCLLIGTGIMLKMGYQRYMMAAYPVQYEEYVEKYAEQNGFTPSLIYAVIHTESGFDPNAVSSAKAKGLMQLTDDTFNWAQSRSPETESLSPNDLFDPETNICYGTYTLRLLYEQFKDRETALAAYNAGIGRVRSWLQDPRYSDDGVTLKDIPYSETADYVEKINKAQKMYQELYRTP